MFSERMSVSLDDFIKYLLGKWKYIFVCVMVCMIFSCVSARLSGNKIVIPPDEKYADLKEQEEYFEDYINNSVLMDMNPLNIYEKTIVIDDVSDRDALKGQIDSGEIWKKSDETLPVQYLAELVTWDERTASQAIEIKVQHSEEAECVKLADDLVQQIRAFDHKAEVTVGETRTVIDKSVSDEQMWFVNRLQDIKGQLEYTASGCIIEVSYVVALILGIFLGGLMSFIILFCMFLWKQNRL